MFSFAPIAKKYHECLSLSKRGKKVNKEIEKRIKKEMTRCSLVTRVKLRVPQPFL